MIKATFALLTLACLVGCSGPGGPAQRAGRSVDNAMYKVGTGIERTGEAVGTGIEHAGEKVQSAASN